MEQWDLYNGRREPTGRRMKRGEEIPPGLYHLSVSAWVMNRRGQFLLSQRSPQKTFPLCWECTGGAVLAGEDSLTAALRECREELGFALAAGQGQRLFQRRREATQDFYDVWLFFAEVDVQTLTLQESEVVDVKWVDKDVLRAMACDGKLHPLIDYVEALVAMAEGTEKTPI